MKKFIAFEGLDGAGKSTLIQSLVEELKKQQTNYVLTREPGGTELAEKIRQLLLSTEVEKPSEKTELLLYEASRAQHVSQVIRPALEKGEWVLCDRFTASTLAFQSGGRGLSESDIHWLNNYATGGLEPTLTVLLDIDVDSSQKRSSGRTDRELDRMEREKREFHEAVRVHYLKQANQNPSKWLVLQAKDSVEQLSEQLLTHLRTNSWL